VTAGAEVPTPRRGGYRWWLAGALACLFVVVLLRTAWISDDAYITLRVVDNLLQGHGPNWNVGERVQVFTHPLWFLLLSVSTLMTGEFYLTTIIVSVICSLAAFLIVLLALTRSTWGMLAAGLALTLSPSMIDYATSGLENPLSYLLVALFSWVTLRQGRGPRHTFRLVALASLLCVTRLDLVVLVAPVVIDDIVRRRHVRAAALASLPLIVWLLFSLAYYGAVIPNTAFAKLHAGVERSWYLAQGMYYLGDTAWRAPMMALVVLGGLLVGFRSGRREAFLCSGIVLYIVYVVWIGGDFMRGRMLTVPTVAAIALLADGDFAIRRRPLRLALLLVIVAVGFLTPHPTLLSGSRFGTDADQRTLSRQTRGITDERAFYFREFGLLNGKPLHLRPGHDVQALRAHQAEETVAIKLIGTAGLGGFLSGPLPYAIEEYALASPLLSHMPVSPEAPRRIGHLQRDIPAGYVLSLLDGVNRIVDPRLRQVNDHILRITRGPLFSADRIRSIAAMAIGRYDDLIPDVITPLSDEECVTLASRDLHAPGPRLLWRAARVHCRAADFAKAEPILRRLGELDIAHADEYIRPAINILLGLSPRQPDFSEKLMRLILELEPASPDAQYGMGALLMVTGRSREGRTWLRRAAALGSDEARRALEQQRD
jgi:arabinofuranosyltransferase